MLFVNDNKRLSPGTNVNETGKAIRWGASLSCQSERRR